MSFVVHTPRSHGTHGLAEKAVCGLLHIQWGTARHASFVRCVLLAIWCVHLIVTPYHIYSDWPAEGLRGFGAMAVVAETPYRGILFDAAVLTGLRVAGIVLCLYLAMSRRGRLLTWVVVVIVYVLDGASKTIGGYANHAQIVPLLGLVACAVCSKVPYQPAADLLVMREDTVNTQSASAASGFVWLVALLVVVPYAFVALNRVVIGGVGVFSGDAMVNYTMAACGAQPQIVCREIGNWLHDDRVATLWRLGFALATGVEIASIAALVWPRCRRVWCVAVVAFHGATWATMNILFWENALVVSVKWWKSPVASSSGVMM